MSEELFCRNTGCPLRILTTCSAGICGATDKCVDESGFCLIYKYVRGFNNE